MNDFLSPRIPLTWAKKSYHLRLIYSSSRFDANLFHYPVNGASQSRAARTVPASRSRSAPLMAGFRSRPAPFLTSVRFK